MLMQFILSFRMVQGWKISWYFRKYRKYRKYPFFRYFRFFSRYFRYIYIHC